MNPRNRRGTRRTTRKPGRMTRANWVILALFAAVVVAVSIAGALGAGQSGF